MMKRWEMNTFGRTNLRLVQTARPRPKRGEVLVRVAAVSLNYRDRLVIENGMGSPLPFPFTPASDLAGLVESVGDGVTRLQTGDHVISTFFPGWIDGLPPGSGKVLDGRALGSAYQGVLSEYVSLPEDWLVKAPSTLDMPAAATLPCAGLTAWSALMEDRKIQPGSTVLVHGTGGVALFGVQIGKAYGAKVIVTSGDAVKLAQVAALGADHTIDRRQEDWVQSVLRLTGNQGVDSILELVGGGHLGRSLEALAVGGCISLIGVFEGYEFNGSTSQLMMKAGCVRGIRVGHRRGLENLVRGVDATSLAPVIDATYPLDALPAALDHLERGPFGKVVVTLS